MLRLFFSLGLLCAAASSAHAWNAYGHMAVAQIAYNHLDPAVKNKCDALIAVPLANVTSANSNFVTAACWADDNKTALGTAIWHYIDLPFSLDGTSTNGVSPASFDVVRAIRQCVSILQNPATSQPEQATNLRYLLHFVGDIQQPLHASDAVSSASPSGDGGGNSFSLNGPWSNLHSLWDGGGGYISNSLSRPMDTASQASLSNKVFMIETDYPFSSNVGPIPDPMTWAQEGLGLAKTVAYVGINRFDTPSTSYLNSAAATTEQRLSLGGQRLANMLNNIFAPPAITLIPLQVSNGKFVFSWTASTGKTYRVQWKQQLDASAWNDLTNITASANLISLTNVIALPNRFYRVTVTN